MPVTWDTDEDHIRKILTGLKRYYVRLIRPGCPVEEWCLGFEIANWALEMVDSPHDNLENIRFLVELASSCKDTGSAWFDLCGAVKFVQTYIVRDIPP